MDTDQMTMGELRRIIREDPDYFKRQDPEGYQAHLDHLHRILGSGKESQP